MGHNVTFCLPSFPTVPFVKTQTTVLRNVITCYEDELRMHTDFGKHNTVV